MSTPNPFQPDQKTQRERDEERRRRSNPDQEQPKPRPLEIDPPKKDYEITEEYWGRRPPGR